ncbi:MAG: hypothetical protein AB8H79_11785 [Myxococcota bacterium]
MQLPIPPPNIALVGGLPPWPLVGHVRGSWSGDTVSVAWAGAVCTTQGPEAGWRMSRTLERLLQRGGPASGDRRRVLSVLWARLDGEALADDLVLLLASRDEHGVALSAVGCTRLFGSREGVLLPWLHPPHPMLTPPGPPVERPGALALDAVPDWLIAVADGTDLEGLALEAVLPQCGVYG